MDEVARAFQDQNIWREISKDLDNPNLGSNIFSNIRFEDQEFKGVVARGCTIQSSYFIRCTFIDCNLKGAAFEKSNFEDCIFISSVLSGLEISSSNFSRNTFKDCQMDEVTIAKGEFRYCEFSGGRIGVLRAEGVSGFSASCQNVDTREIHLKDTDLSLFRVKDVHDVNIRITRVSGNLRVQSSTLQNIEFVGEFGPDLNFDESVVYEINCGNLVSNLKIIARASFIYRTSMQKIDLRNSVFTATSFVGCEWPSQTGVTNLWGRFVPPANLLGQPVGDLSGLSNELCAEIERSQSLNRAEQLGPKFTWRWILHRIVGMTTSHGRSPLRLLITSLIPPALLTVLHYLLEYFDRRGAGQVFATPSLAEIKKVYFDYFSIIAGYGDRAKIALDPALEIFAWAFSVIFLGLFVTLFTNYIFKR